MSLEGARTGQEQPALNAQNAPIIDLTFDSTFRWVRRAVHESMDALEPCGLAPEFMGSIEIVLAEALNNIVEHAYPANEPGKIRLLLRLRSAGVLVEIRDQGRAMPGGRIPLGNHPMSEFNTDAMPEGGYGWYLIRELVHDLIYDRQNDENVLIFRMGFAPSK